MEPETPPRLFVRHTVLALGTGALVLASFGLAQFLLPHQYEDQAAAVGRLETTQSTFTLLEPKAPHDVGIEGQFMVHTQASAAHEGDGIFLVSHATIDGAAGYYAGFRVDGTMVIEKRQRGKTTLLAQEAFFQGVSDPMNMLLPREEWLFFRSETTTEPGGIRIQLYVRQADEAEWTLLLSALDTDQPLRAFAAGFSSDLQDLSTRALIVTSL